MSSKALEVLLAENQRLAAEIDRLKSERVSGKNATEKIAADSKPVHLCKDCADELNITERLRSQRISASARSERIRENERASRLSEEEVQANRDAMNARIERIRASLRASAAKEEAIAAKNAAERVATTAKAERVARLDASNPYARNAFDDEE